MYLTKGNTKIIVINKKIIAINSKKMYNSYLFGGL